MISPDKWQLIKVKTDEEEIYVIMSGFSGGYLDGDSWRISSKVVACDHDLHSFRFTTVSGSKYFCRKSCVGFTPLSLSVFKKYQEKIGKKKFTVTSAGRVFKSPQLHCCIDLELEQPKTRPDTQDSLLDKEQIIQVGYVIYQLEPEFVIHKEVCEHVNIGVPLSKFIKKLTGISDDDIKAGKTIHEIYNMMQSDLDTYRFSRIIKQWGSGDMDCLRRELPDVSWPFGHSGCNIKHLYQMYAEANGVPISGGLKRVMYRCGVKWSGSAHNALFDAKNTAKMHKFLFDKMKDAK